jgi:hypothetical protein
MRLSDKSPEALAQGNEAGGNPFGNHFEEVLQTRRKDADEFYAAITSLVADEANVFRQALAGMLWTKQFYHYDLHMQCLGLGKKGTVEVVARAQSGLPAGDLRSPVA